MIIPVGCTIDTQALDVFYFRPYKNFFKFIAEAADDDDLKIWQRDAYLKIQSFTHYQFQAPRFAPMVQYAFHKSGYRITADAERPPKFVVPRKFCFYFEGHHLCSYASCHKTAQFLCAHCENYLCLQHSVFDVLHVNCM